MFWLAANKLRNKLSRAGWGLVGGWLDYVKIRLTQPQVELEAWAELGNIIVIENLFVFIL